jgi:hypothetical protein
VIVYVSAMLIFDDKDGIDDEEGIDDEDGVDNDDGHACVYVGFSLVPWHGVVHTRTPPTDALLCRTLSILLALAPRT